MTESSAKKNEPLVQVTTEPDRDAEFRGPFYELRKRKVWFSDEVRIEHARLQESLWAYIRGSRFFVALTSPYIYGCIIPFMILDLFITLYRDFRFRFMGYRRCGGRTTSSLTREIVLSEFAGAH